MSPSPCLLTHLCPQVHFHQTHATGWACLKSPLLHFCVICYINAFQFTHTKTTEQCQCPDIFGSQGVLDINVEEVQTDDRAEEGGEWLLCTVKELSSSQCSLHPEQARSHCAHCGHLPSPRHPLASLMHNKCVTWCVALLAKLDTDAISFIVGYCCCSCMASSLFHLPRGPASP